MPGGKDRSTAATQGAGSGPDGDAAFTPGRKVGLAITLLVFLVLTALIVATALRSSPPPPDPIAGRFRQQVPVVRATVAVLLGMAALALWSVRSKVLDTPVLELAGARPGPALYRGTVGADGPVTAPLTATRCAWYRSTIHGSIRADVASSVHLVDSTGRVAIDPSMRAHGPDQRVVYQQGKDAQEERVLAVGEQVTVYADAALDDAGALVLVPHTSGLRRWSLVRRIVSNGVVGDAHRQLGMLRVGSVALLGAAAVVWMSLWLVQTWSTRSTPQQSAMVLPREPVRTAVVVAACSLGFVAAAAVISRRNRLVALRNQIDHATGVIEVAAQQRHDLILSLLGAVRLGVEHEGAVRAGVDLIRADGADRGRIASLEPERGAPAADPLFAGLHTQLVRCEDRLAAARRFHNDAVTVARDRAGTLPTVLIRPLVFPRGIPPLLDFGLASGSVRPPSPPS